MAGMYSATSPTRSMIKEANDHLQLLHQRVQQLEQTVKEQAEAMLKKDEESHARIYEIIQSKDAVINNMTQTVDELKHRVHFLEQQCHEKDCRLATFSSQQDVIAELVTYSPVLTGLLSTLQKLPQKPSQDGQVDGHAVNSERRVNRSFKINSNFSMSEEDSDDDY